jgi:Rieske Fe-S protein
MSESNAGISRRDFIKGTCVLIGGCVGTLITVPAIAYLISPVASAAEGSSWIDLGPFEEYPFGAPTLREFTRTHINGWERTGTSYGVFVVRPDAQTVRVFSNICTHLACHINWHPDVQHFISPCHDGHFDTLGKNISGPPPRPLDEFVTRLQAGKLSIQWPPFKRIS